MPRLDQDDRFTLSPLARQVKRRSSPQQWKTIRRKAHKRGFTVSSFVDSSVPNALKERTRGGITRQARETINAAFAPVELELTQEEKRVKAVDEKRKRDNDYYRTWLAQRSDQMRIHTRLAQQQLQDTQREIVDQQLAATGAMRQQIQQSVAAMPGVVSDPQQATAANVQPEMDRNAKLLAAQRTQTTDMQRAEVERQATNDASNFAFIAADEARRASDTWSRLAAIGDARQKLKLDKAAKTAEEVARMLDIERENASANREFGVVMQELGLDVAQEEHQQKSKEANFKAQYGISMDRYNNMSPEQRLAWRRKWAKAGKAAPKKVGKVTYHYGYTDSEWAGMSVAQRRRAKAAWDQAGKGEGDGEGGVKRQRRFEQAYSLIHTSSTPGTPGSGNEPGKPGKPYSKEYVKNHRNKVINQLIAEGYNRNIAEAAVNAFIQLGGKRPGDVKRWKSRLGLPPDGDYWPGDNG